MVREAQPDISVVVLSRNEGELLRRTVETLDGTLPPAAEILVVDDGSTDGSADFLEGRNPRARLFRSSGLGVARGRNFGARQARGRFLVFSDAHIETPPGWWEPLLNLLRDPAVGAAGPGIVDYADRERRGFGMRLIDTALHAEWLCPEYDDPFPVPLLPGGFWAVRRELFESVGGLDDEMLRWGAEDFEFSLRLWMLGYDLWVAPEVEVAHVFRKAGPYPVEGRWPRHNVLRTAFLHFSSDRFERVKRSLAEMTEFEEGLELFRGNVPIELRRNLRSRCRRNETEYFQTFGEI